VRHLGRHYQRFLSAAAVSSLGDGLLTTALPLLATQVTDNPVQVAAVYAAGKLPWASALAVGAFVDRRDARNVLVGADIARAILLALFGAYLIIVDEPVPVWMLLLLSFGLSVGAIMFFTASQRVLPVIVESGEFEEANGSLTAVQTGGEMLIGPPLGAWLVGTIGPKVPILGDAVSFGLSGIALAALPAIPPDATDSSLSDDIKLGWAWFRSSQLVRFMTATIAIGTMLSAAPLATEVLLVTKTLNLSDWWFGIFTAVLAAGSIVGSTIAPHVISRLRATTFTAANVLLGICYLACVGSRSPFVVFGALFAQQALTMISVVATVSVRLRAIPAALRGRVFGLIRTFTFGLQVFGALFGGWMIKRSGTDLMFLVCGALITILGLVTARPLRTLIEEAESQSPAVSSVVSEAAS
jgi:MFS family permease